MQTKVKEKPILFNAEMVRAVLEGRKTQTRRVVKGLPGDAELVGFKDGYATFAFMEDYGDGVKVETWETVRCPYGQPGGRLWVRETWAHYQTVNAVHRIDGRAFSEVSDGLAGYRADGHGTIEDFRRHIASMSDCDLEAVEINGDRWRPSIHMTRWASRITLEVVSVRVERVQEIKPWELALEGINVPPGPPMGPQQFINVWRPKFIALWDSINEKRGYGWDQNPFVWCVEFKRVDP